MIYDVSTSPTPPFLSASLGGEAPQRRESPSGGGETPGKSFLRVVGSRSVTCAGANGWSPTRARYESNANSEGTTAQYFIFSFNIEQYQTL